MRKHFIYLGLLLTTVGCASAMSKHVQDVTRDYDMIVYRDGISREEAITIAQRELIKRNVLKIYDYDSPRIMTNVDELPNQEKYWFVSFRERKIANIEYTFVVIVNKENGKVRFSDDFQEGKQWILEAVLLGG